MKNNDILLNEIYNNSVTAINVISAILRKTEKGSMFDCLFDRMLEYREIADIAYNLLQNKIPPNNENSLYSHIAVFWTFGKPSSQRLAKILISGSKEGFSSLIDSVNSCTSATKEARQLAYRLIELEDKNISEMQKFIKG